MELISTFPDPEYLGRLARHLKDKIEQHQQGQPLEQLLMSCSAAMNWIADFLTDPNVRWTKQELRVDDLWLTGTNPTWNAIIIDRCKRSPAELRAILRSDPQTAALFAEAEFDELPILVRVDDGKYKVLDGMHRVIAAIRDGRESVTAFVARLDGQPRPQCEPHVVYDLLRAYHRGINRDRQALVVALRFLRHAYANVDRLLRERFSKAWVPDDEMQAIIAEALQE
ncbi:MAG: ParB N-terminal domain-containing protein [Candidatus Kerfeldbacteria bacterium]|nr:ParB N-terminal domain-containing protein [Candidatus Kerfeldbacteria bacterium]